jgi:thermitase
MKGMTIRILPQHLTLTGALALALCLLVLLGAAGPTQAQVGEEDYRPGQIIVEVDTSVAIEEIHAEHGTETIDDYFGSMGFYLIKPPAHWTGTEVEFAKQIRENDPRVLHAEPNYVADTPEGDGRMKARNIGDSGPSSSDYAAENLRLPCASRISQGKGITVAVLDTGAQLNHPALKANFEGVARYDFVGDDANPSEPRRVVGVVGHGTHVAAIVDRVAPKAKIMPLRVLNAQGSGDVFRIAKAISYAQRNGAHVINLSLGSSSHSKLLQEIIQNAITNGVIVVAAAGNSGTETAHYPAAGDGISPGSADGLVAVTAVDKYEKNSWFANYGPWVDIAAPGTGIRSAFPVDKYANWSGTSMATPFISGQAALIRNVYSSLTPGGIDGIQDGIEARIRGSARSIDLNHDPKLWTKLGKGHADVCESLQSEASR